MKYRGLWLGVVLVLGASPGCKKEEPPKSETIAPPPAQPSEPAKKEPEPEASPLAEVESALQDFSKSSELVSAAERVAGYLARRPDAPDVQRARELLAGAELGALALAVGGEPALADSLAKKLGSKESGDDASLRYLSKSLRDLTQGAAAGSALGGIAEATKVLVGFASSGASTPQAVAAGLEAPGIAGQAVRLAALRAAGRGIEAFTKAAPAARATALPADAAGLLCSGCAGKLTEAGGDLMAAVQAGEAGLVCAEAREQVKGKSPAEVAALLAKTCKADFYGVVDAPDIALAQGPNLAIARLLALRRAAANAGEGPLATAIEAQAANIAIAPRLALALPWVPATVELSQGGPVWNTQPLDVVTVDKEGVRGALRPVLEVGASGGSFVGRAEGRTYPGELLVAAEPLIAPPSTEGEGAEVMPTPGEVLRTKLGELKAAAASVVGTLMESERLVTPETRAQAMFAVAEDADGRVVAEAGKALAASGYGAVRIVSGTRSQDYVPAVLATADNAGGAAAVVYERPVLVHLDGTKTEVFPPAGSAKSETEKKASPLPTGATPWFLWEDVFKADIPKGPEEAKVAAATVQAFAERSGDGNVVLVEMDPDVPVSRWLPIVAAVGLSGSRPVNAAEAYPGVACAGTDAHCPSRLPVLFSGTAIPRSSQLTAEPRTREKKEVPPPVEAKPEPSPEFCNKGDIERVMGGKASAFKFCYERELQTYPDLQGRVTVRFNIPESGKAESIRIGSSELKNDKIHQCIIKQVEKLHFEKPKGGVCAVNWPFIFKN